MILPGLRPARSQRDFLSERMLPKPFVYGPKLLRCIPAPARCGSPAARTYM
jgi:hypothetical protein